MQMSVILFSLCCANIFAPVDTTASSDVEAEKIVMKAIDACGGKEKVQRWACQRGSGSGTLMFQGKECRFTITVWRTPGKSKSVYWADVDDAKVDLIRVMDGNKLWESSLGITRELDCDTPPNSIRRLATYAADLLPLLNRHEFSLSVGEDEEIKDRRALKVNANAINQKATLNLSFDAVTGLLIKNQFHTVDPTGRETLHEVYHENYKEFNSVKYPAKIVTYVDGKKNRETIISELQFPDHIGDEVFANPEISLEKEAQSILAKAIEAAGGKTELEKLRCVNAKMSGYGSFGQWVPYAVEQSWKLPNMIKAIRTIKGDTGTSKAVMVLNGDKLWKKDESGAAIEEGPQSIAVSQAELFMCGASTLVPLQNKEIKVRRAGIKTVDNRTAQGIWCQSKNGFSITLFIDKQTNLLSKLEARVRFPGLETEDLLERFFQDYEMFGRVKRPKKAVTYMNGVKTSELILTEFEVPTDLDDAIFEKP